MTEVKDELDRETLSRINLENKIQTVREELEFKESLKDKVRDRIARGLYLNQSSGGHGNIR